MVKQIEVWKIEILPQQPVYLAKTVVLHAKHKHHQLLPIETMIIKT